jgi:hypothetical protein
LNSKKILDVKIIWYKSYLKAVENSAGSNSFRNLYARVGGKKADILRDGILSCATFVSSILYLFKLISDVHATVGGTVADLKKSGWIKVKKPRAGAILVWEYRKVKNKEQYKHIGFYIGKNKAISNDSKKRQPILHHWTFGARNGRPARKVEQIFWNKKLR